MKKTMAVMMLLAGALMAAPRVAIGIGIGAPAPVVVARPACPGPGYTWVDGYYAPDGLWVAGYWAAPMLAVAPPAAVVTVGPRFVHAPVYAPRFEHFRR